MNIKLQALETKLEWLVVAQARITAKIRRTKERIDREKQKLKPPPKSK